MATEPNRTDREIDARTFQRARRGDRRAFAAVVRHYDPGLRALAYRLLGDRTKMDDALQDAYVNAFRGLPHFRGESALSTWLYRITYNACLDELRRSRPVVPLERARDRPDPRALVADHVIARSSLEYALTQLAPEDRAAVLLVDAQGFGYRQAAEVLGVPEGTIASRLNRARMLLRHTLTERIEGASSP